MNCLIKINKKALILAAVVLALVMPGTAYSYQVINKTISQEIITRGVVLKLQQIPIINCQWQKTF
jgi:hypothetical protein